MSKGITPDTIISVVGSLAGVVLGAAINALSSRGRIKIELSDKSIIFRVNVKTEIDGEYFDGEEEAGENQIPELVCISFKVKLYNNTNKTGGINNASCFMKVGKIKYPINCSFQGFNDLTNIEPHRYVETFISQHGTAYINNNIAEKLLLGCKIYLRYYINGKKFCRKKLLYKR